jgi:hypothetical protein
MCTRPDAAGSDQKSVSIQSLKPRPHFKQSSRHASPRGGFLFRSRLLELARVLVRVVAGAYLEDDKTVTLELRSAAALLTPNQCYRSRCPLHRKRESRHCVSGCSVWRSRLRC